MKKFGVEPDHPPEGQEAWSRFLEHVDRFYHEADQDRYLLERSLSISSHEMQDLYEQLLQASESRVAAERDKLRTVISSLGAGLCTLDREGRVLSINPEGERLLGCNEAGVLNQPFFAWTTPSGDGQALQGGCSLEEVVISGEPCREEDGVFMRKDGTRLPVSYTLNPIIEAGVLQGAVLVFFDISERKQAEQALRESEERHRTLLNHLPVGVYRSTPEGRFIKANPATAELFGTESVEALLGWDVQDLFYDATDRDRFVGRLLRDGIVTYEFPVRRIDGEVIWVRDYARAIQDETDGSIFFDGILLDITERKEAERQFRQMHTELEHLFTTIPIGMCLLDHDLRYLHINKVLADFNGRSVADHIGRTLQEMIPDIAPLVEPLYRQVLESGEPYRGIELRSGTQPEPHRERDWLIDLYDFRSVDGTMLGVLVILQDITERKQAEEVEQRRTKLLDLAQEIAQLGSWEWDVKTGEIQWSDELYRIFGLPVGSEIDWAAIRETAIHPDDRAMLSERLETAHTMHEANLPPIEYRILRPDGTERSVWGNNVVFFDQDEQPVRMVCAIQDITERKRAEHALRESEQRFRDLFESSPDAIFVEDFDGNVLDVNPAACRLHNSDPEQLIGQNVRALVPPDQREASMEVFGRLVLGELDRLEGSSWTADGQEVPVEIRASRITQDQQPALLLQVRDITERKQAEQRLRLLEAAALASIDGITISDARAPDYPLVYISPGFERMTGYTAEEIVGRNCRFLQKDDRDQPALDEIRAAIKEGAECRVVLRNYRKDGTLFWNELTLYPLHDNAGHLTHYVGIQRDITVRKEVEQALRQSEERYRELVESAQAIVWRGDPHTFQFTFVSQEAEALLGYPVARWLDEPTFWVDHIHPDDRAWAPELCAKATQEHRAHEFEYRMIAADGRVVWLRDMVKVVVEDGQLKESVGVMIDVTERKQMEEALRRSEERYTLAVSAGNVGVWDWNLDTNEIYIDPILKQILGYEDHEIKNQLDDWGRLVHPDDQEKVMEAATAHLEGVVPIYEVEHRMLHRDGSIRWFVARGSVMHDAQGKPVRMVGTDTDITERKQAEQERARINTKLEQRNRELQDFAYVASHDLQEPLRKIRAFADLMQEDYGDKVDETGHYFLDRMQDAAARMSGLITDLLAYSRVTTQVRPFGRVDLNSIVADVLSDLEMQIEETGGRITVSNLPAIEADATQMHQLLQNFIANALKFHQADVPPVIEVIGRLEQQPAQNGDAPQMVCRLEVRDNGIGFDEKYLDRIFTPFQRLHGRSTYAGTGMGLAICRRIVERHHGAIAVQSTPGEGATFIVTLPVHQRSALADRGEREGEKG